MSVLVFLVLRFMIAGLLYVFLGAVVYLLWLDLRRFGVRALPQIPSPIILQYEREGEIYPLRFTDPEVIIGRDLACNCILENTTVSARHARVYFRQAQWWVEDLHSTNGSYLNQEPVGSPTVLTSGDQLRCGQVTLSITVE